MDSTCPIPATALSPTVLSSATNGVASNCIIQIIAPFSTVLQAIATMEFACIILAIAILSATILAIITTLASFCGETATVLSLKILWLKTAF